MTADPKPGKRPRTPRDPASRLSRKGERRDQAWVEARAVWRKRAVMYGCVACRFRGGECEGQLAGHHWLYEQHIRRYLDAHAHEHQLTVAQFRELELELVWAHANGGGLCERAHRRHHNRTEPIPLEVVPLRAITFAASLGLAHRLEAAYPAAGPGARVAP